MAACAPSLTSTAPIPTAAWRRGAGIRTQSEPPTPVCLPQDTLPRSLHHLDFASNLILTSLPSRLCVLTPCRRRPSFEEVDAELVRIEMEFRLACHRTATASKRTSTTSQSGGSAPPSRPGSPEVQPRCGVAAGGGGALARQLQAAALAD